MLKEQTGPGFLKGAFRGLRLRLALTYVISFAIVLAGIGFIFSNTLTVMIHQQSHRILEGEWSALKAYLRAPQGELAWVFDPADADDAKTVERLRRVFMLAQTDGQVLEMSKGYAALGPETREQIQNVARMRDPVLVLRKDSRGTSYVVRMGVLRGQGKPYVAAIGLPVENALNVAETLLRTYFLMLPVMLLAIIALGWYAAGRALHPLSEVVNAAKKVSAGNLSLRIPQLGTDDELDTLIATFNGMMGRLESNFEQMRRFSVDASHEMRTPLTAIRGQLEVALMTARNTEQYRSAVETALQDVERLGKIVKSLLHLAQAESGQVRLHKTEQELLPIVEQHVAQFTVAAEEKRIKIMLDSSEPCPAAVDRTQFEKLLSNLLSNAVQYTQAGGEVRVGLSRDNGEIKLAVGDNGPGIPEAHLPHIFERFYRIRSGDRGPEKGVGLGLALVQWIVKAHGGRIAVKSSPGSGSTFEVHLPAES